MAFLQGSQSSLSVENVQLIRRWVGDCEANHPYCELPAGTNREWMPRRVLEINAGNVKLLDSAAIEGGRGTEAYAYAALSHVWGVNSGHESPLLTLQSNLGDMQKGVPVDALPKSLADAVFVCRELGLRYLWIDALCIIQDLPEDFNDQISEMHRVYQHAYITIAA